MNLSYKAREEAQEIQVLAPLSASERGWGRGQNRLVEFTSNNKYIIAEPLSFAGEPQNFINEPPSLVNEPQNSINEPQNSINEPRSLVNEPWNSINEPPSFVNEPSELH